MKIMEFKHKRQQWAVGHGFFHTASIAIEDLTCRYVYDCGSKNKGFIKREIDRYTGNEKLEGQNQELDMLVISHFHTDHYNGIPYLLKYFKIKKLVIPYLSEDAQIGVLAYMASIDLMEWQNFSGLVTNPVNWLNERESPDVQVIQVSNDAKEVSDEAPIPENGDGLGIGNGLGINNIQTQINHASPGAIFRNSHPVWRFKFYVENNQSLGKSIVNDILIKFPISKGELLNSLKDATWISNNLGKLKECFTSIAKQKRRNLNSTNLSMFSGAINPYVLRSNFHPFCTSTVRCCFLENRRMGWLGTGDAELKKPKAFDAFEQSFKSYLNTIDTVTVPHHGSRRDYNAKISNFGLRHIITSGCENNTRYKLPASEVLLNLLINSPSVKIVTTDQCTALFDYFSGVLE